MSPRWVPKSAVIAIHEMLIMEHGGVSGLRSDSALESSLANPKNSVAYGSPDLFDLAASYAASLTRNHPFHDGNKRTALTIAGVFLELNGIRLEVSETDAVSAVVALTTKELDQAAFAEWLRQNSRLAPGRSKTAVDRSKRVKATRRSKSKPRRR